VSQGYHLDAGVGVPVDVVELHFGGGYDSLKSTDASIEINPTPAVGEGFQTWAVMRPSVQRHKGHLDIYGTHGYESTGVWCKDNIITTDYSYFQPYVTTGVTPFNPSAGWNPPGY
jgi:hypothetical protein